MRRKDLSTDERASILHFILQNTKDGVPNKGIFGEAATNFGVCRRTINRLWSAAKEKTINGEPMSTQSRKSASRFGGRVQIDFQKIESVALSKRSTIRSLALGIGVTKSTVGRWVKKGLIKAHTSAIKPTLSLPNQLERVRFSLQALEYDKLMKVIKFKNMQHTVHIDEKWFYISKGNNRYYLTLAEVEPHRTCQSKKFITKVMFMCAVCRPLFGQDGEVIFDGKIGIFPFTEMVPAQRNSKNRDAGTMEQKSINSVTKQVIKDCVINQILPAIKAKWPTCLSKVIKIQQDNARPHLKDNDPDFRAAASSDGFDISIVHQPPNSPDTNINDLGWFRTIQSLQQKTVCNNIDQLVLAVINSHESEDPMKLNKVFLTLQGCMIEILKVRGMNCYKVPHIGKDALTRQDLLPDNLWISEDIVRNAMHHLMDAGMGECISQMGENLRIQLIPDLNGNANQEQ